MQCNVIIIRSLWWCMFVCLVNVFFFQKLDLLYLEQRSEKLTVEDMKELRYLECVIKVGHRLQPHDHVAANLL